jgi:hypothetical protein
LSKKIYLEVTKKQKTKRGCFCAQKIVMQPIIHKHLRVTMVTNGDTKWIKMASLVPKISENGQNLDPNLDEAHWHISLALPRFTAGLSE